MKHRDTSRRPYQWLIIGGAIVGVVIGGIATYAYLAKNHKLTRAQCEQTLINPTACDGELEGKVSFESFRKNLEEELRLKKDSGDLIEAGIYFRDLRFGPIFSINDDEQFIPMSLLKLPLMIAILKSAETREGLLEEKLRTPSEFAMNVQMMAPGETLVPDREYTIAELLKYMIVYSDNKALGMLSRWIDAQGARNMTADTLIKLGLMREGEEIPSTTVSPRIYGSILRILYNAAYLSPESSQYALELLAETTFRDGIAHDVSDDTVVAHKFGIREDPGVEVQLHDCGIVYHPGGPYILCVMTRGTSYTAQAAYVQDVASQVYREMTNRMQEAK